MHGRWISDTRISQPEKACDAQGRLLAVTNALDYVTRFECDELGQQTTQIDALNRATRHQYDAPMHWAAASNASALSNRSRPVP